VSTKTDRQAKTGRRVTDGDKVGGPTKCNNPLPCEHVIDSERMGSGGLAIKSRGANQTYRPLPVATNRRQHRSRSGLGLVLALFRSALAL
jgi:hypothetical protein